MEEAATGVGSIVIFILGAILLIYSAEKLISYLIGAAATAKISLFLLAVIFTGIEFDDVFLGVALGLEDLSGVALGLVFGTAVSFIGIVLAAAMIFVPCEVRIPRDYLAIFAVSPLVLFAFVLTAPLTTVHAISLIALFVAFIIYVWRRETRRQTAVFRNAEVYEHIIEKQALGVRDAPAGVTSPRRSRLRLLLPGAPPPQLSGKLLLVLAAAALAGLVVGAYVTGEGTEGIIEGFGIEETLFGATIATLVLTIEDLLLTVEPARRGAPELGVGNIIGSVVFSVTAKLGIILLFGGSLVVDDSAITCHPPVLVVRVALAAAFLLTGHLRRCHGIVLFGLHVAYWAVSFSLYGEAPIEAD